MANDYDRYDEPEGTGGGFMLGLLTGTVIGAGLGMLFAPKSGAELRGQLGEQAGNLGRAAQDQYRRASEAASTVADRARETYGQVADRAREAVNRGVEEARSYTSRGSEGYATSGGGTTGSTGGGSFGTGSSGTGSSGDYGTGTDYPPSGGSSGRS